MQKTNIQKLTRNCAAILIPAGDSVTLESGTHFGIKQALGGTITIQTDMGLFRIAAEDLDALGDIDPQNNTNTAEEASHTGPLSEDLIWEQLKKCYDPEIPVNIVDLGLIYSLSLQESASGQHEVALKMTLTAQGCGMGPTIAQDAKEKIEQLSQVDQAHVEIVWDPVWTPHMISPQGRKAMGLE